MCRGMLHPTLGIDLVPRVWWRSRQGACYLPCIDHGAQVHKGCLLPSGHAWWCHSGRSDAAASLCSYGSFRHVPRSHPLVHHIEHNHAGCRGLSPGGGRLPHECCRCPSASPGQTKVEQWAKHPPLFVGKQAGRPWQWVMPRVWDWRQRPQQLVYPMPFGCLLHFRWVDPQSQNRTSRVSVPPPPEGEWWTGSLEEAGPGLCGRYLQQKPKRQRAPAW